MNLGLQIAQAATSETIQKVDALFVKLAVNIINPIIYLGFSAAVLLFIWGVFCYMKDAGDSGARETGSRHMLFGVIGMAIMLSAYGIINLVSNSLQDAVNAPAPRGQEQRPLGF